MVDEAGAIWLEAAHHFDGRQGYQPRYVILHGTAGGSSAQETALYFSEDTTQASAHYVIDEQGIIYQCVREHDAAWANGPVTGLPGRATPDSGDGYRDSWWSPDLNPNFLTIAIEHVKPSLDNSDSLTAEQSQASFLLVKHICERWNIPTRWADAQGGITGHFSMDAINRTHCPGPYPWPDLFTFLEGGAMDVPAGWKDDGTTLLAPNGHKVTKGFRDWILAHVWDPQNYPLEEEHGQTPLEESNLPLGGGTQQMFRMSCLEWTPQRGVFVSWIGQEVLALRVEVAGLKKGKDV